MKSIFRTIAFLLVLYAAVSCGKDGWYISLDNTSWFYEQDGIRAYLHFDPEDRVSIVQVNFATGSVQFSNGTYRLKGHSVMIESDEGVSSKFIRTFSHLKTSKSKNFSRWNPQDAGTLEHTVWASLRKNVFSVISFGKNGEAVLAMNRNLVQEGVSSSWQASPQKYSLAGHQVTLSEGMVGTLFQDLMLVGDVWYVRFAPGEDEGTSDICGSLWSQEGGKYAGIVVFNTNSAFTRIVAGSSIVFQTTGGTYRQDGNHLSILYNNDASSEEPLRAETDIVENRFPFFNFTLDRLY